PLNGVAVGGVARAEETFNEMMGAGCLLLRDDQVCGGVGVNEAKAVLIIGPWVAKVGGGVEQESLERGGAEVRSREGAARLLDKQERGAGGRGSGEGSAVLRPAVVARSGAADGAHGGAIGYKIGFHASVVHGPP